MVSRDINVRVLQVALIPALIIALLLSLYFARQRLADIENSLGDRAAAISRQLAPAAEFGVFTGNRAALDRLAKAVATENGVTAVVIQDVAGIALASVGQTSLTAKQDTALTAPWRGETADGAALISSSPIFQTPVELEDVFTFTNNTGAAKTPRLLGRVSVVMSKSVIAAQRTRLLVETLVITLLILAANVFIAVRMSRNVSRPIARLTDAVDKISSGNLDVRIEPDSGGVVRKLEEGVNAMAQTLASARADLEQRITDATAEVERRREEAETANRAKSRFLAAASHDLRQPLHALGLFIAGLQGKSLAPDVRYISNQIERSVVAMQDLLEALLDISRLDAGGIAPTITEFPIQRLLSAMESHFASAARAKAITLRIVPSSLNVRSDPKLLECILLNLTSNAIRYAEHGGVLLGCRRRGGGEVTIEVWDTGIGVPVDEQQRIFEEFYRVPGQLMSANQNPGLGLGLAIVDRFAHLLEHQIGMRSQPGKGSMFSIRMPRARTVAREKPVPETDDLIASGDLAGLNVLVIDDDAATRTGAATLLESWGCEVSVASSGDEALAVVTGKDAPHLIVCDYRLSASENGIEVLNRLRVAMGIEVPSILVTADVSADVAGNAKANGFPILYKPLRPAKLRSLALHLLLRA